MFAFVNRLTSDTRIKSVAPTSHAGQTELDGSSHVVKDKKLSLQQAAENPFAKSCDN